MRGRHWADINHCSYNKVTKSVLVWIWLLKLNYKTQLDLYYSTEVSGIKRTLAETV